MEEVNEYWNLIRSAFFVNEEIGKDHDRSIIKEYLKEGYVERAKYQQIWRDFIFSLRQNDKFRVRDISGAGELYSYVGILSYGLKGIVFSVSFPFKLYGFYYSWFTKIEGTARYEESQSYEPYDEEMESYKRWIESSINRFFHGFNQFNNLFADYKIERVVIGHRLYANLDFWKALLSSYSDGLI